MRGRALICFLLLDSIDVAVGDASESNSIKEQSATHINMSVLRESKADAHAQPEQLAACMNLSAALLQPLTAVVLTAVMVCCVCCCGSVTSI